MYTRTFSDNRRFAVVSGAGTTVTSLRTFNGFRSGDRVYNWKQKIRDGLSATSAFTSDRVSWRELEDGESTLVWNTTTSPPGVYNRETWRGFAAPPSVPIHGSVDTVAVNNKALSKILKKIREETSHLNGLAFAGELRETLSMLRRPYAAVAKLVSEHISLLSKRKKGVRNLSTPRGRQAYKDVVTSTWLETQFGLIPLLSDTKDIAEAIARFNEQPPRRARVGAREFQASATQSSVLDAPSGSGEFTRFVRNRRSITRYDVSYSAGLWLVERMADSSLLRLRDVLGLTPENFIPALWEVLPWSWLADYAVNIQEILEAATTDTSSVRWLSKTERWETETFQQNVLSYAAMKKTLIEMGYNVKELNFPSGHLGQGSVVRRTVTRSVPPNLGVPELRFTSPLDLSWKKDANVLAVALQRRKSVELH